MTPPSNVFDDDGLDLRPTEHDVPVRETQPLEPVAEKDEVALPVGHEGCVAVAVNPAVDLDHKTLTDEEVEPADAQVPELRLQTDSPAPQPKSHESLDARFARPVGTGQRLSIPRRQALERSRKRMCGHTI